MYVTHTLKTLISSLDICFVVFIVLLLCQALHTSVMVVVGVAEEADGPVDKHSSELF